MKVKKTKYSIGDCFRVKKGRHKGYLCQIVKIDPYNGWYSVNYADYGADPAKSDVIMGPYIDRELEPIAKRSYTILKKSKMRNWVGGSTKTETPSETDTGTPKKRSRGRPKGSKNKPKNKPIQMADISEFLS